MLASREAEITLIPPHEAPRTPWRDEYHALPIGSPLGLLACIAVAAASGWALHHLLTAPIWVARWGWLLIIPTLLLAIIIPLVIARLLWDELRSALRASNWCVRVRDEALYVNLRSWRNWRLGSSDRTVVRIPWEAIASVNEVREEWRVLPRAGVRQVFKSYIAVRLRDSVATDPIRSTARHEVHRVITHRGFVWGVATWSDVPAFVEADGTLFIQRVEMSLLRALATRVERRERVVQQHWVGPEFPGQGETIESEQIAALVWRGEWVLAQAVAQFRLGMSYDASVSFIERLFAP